MTHSATLIPSLLLPAPGFPLLHFFGTASLVSGSDTIETKAVERIFDRVDRVIHNLFVVVLAPPTVTSYVLVPR